MSAIWGIVNLDQAITLSVAEPLERVYRNYRIDRFERATSPHAIFGCCHQYLTPTAQKEVLPYYDAQNATLFCADCVLDNRTELLAELGLSDSSIPDGALLYASYLRFGNDFPSHCLGAYTAAIFSEKENRLLLFTDHMCNRSLFYTVWEGHLLFSTLLPPLLQTLPVRDCEKWFVACLATTSADMMLYEELTPCEGIRQMPAATCLSCDATGLRKQEYWSPMSLKPTLKLPTKEAVNVGQSEAAYKDYYVDTLSQAVTSMLRSTGEVGCTLSGGLDSTSIAALAAPYLAEHGQTLHSFTSVPLPDFVPDTEDTYMISDESEGVKALCSMYPNIQPSFIACEGQSPFSALARLVPLIGYPMKSGQNLTWLDAIYAEAAGRGCKLMLKGQYGNSTISYGPALGTIYQSLAAGHLVRASRLLKGFSRRYHVPRKHILKLLVKERLSLAFPPKTELKDTLLTTDLLHQYHVAGTITKLNKHYGGGQLDTRNNRLRFIWNPIALQQLSIFDTAMGLIHGLLIRDPSKDKRVVEMCCRMPVEYDLAGNLERGRARTFMAGLIPDSIRLDIHHRGVQSADYEYRCRLCWPTQKEDVRKALQSPLLQPYLDAAKLTAFSRELQTKSAQDITMDEFRLANVIYSAVLQLSEMHKS